MGWLRKRGIQRTISSDGEEKVLTFYPVSIRHLARLEHVVASLWSQMESVRGMTDGYKTIQRTLPGSAYSRKDPDTGETVIETEPPMTVIETEPPSVEMVEKLIGIREEERRRSVHALFAAENLLSVAHLIRLSLKDDEEVQGMTDEQFLEELSGGVFRECILGFLDANKKLFPGPFLKKLERQVAKMMEQFEQEDKEEAPNDLTISREPQQEKASDD